MKRKHTKLIYDGEYVAKVDVELIDTASGWFPYLSLETLRPVNVAASAV